MRMRCRSMLVFGGGRIGIVEEGPRGIHVRSRRVGRHFVGVRIGAVLVGLLLAVLVRPWIVFSIITSAGGENQDQKDHGSKS